MADAYIVDAMRTPVGRVGGGLAALHPADLAGLVLSALISRSGIDPAAVDEVIFGGTGGAGRWPGSEVGVARTAWLVAGLPDSVPAVTLDQRSGSSQQAAQFAAQAVRGGTAGLVIAGGVQLTPVPDGEAGPPEWPGGWLERYGTQEISAGRAAGLIAAAWGISRAELDDYALSSHQRAVAAIDAGAFGAEIVPCGGAELTSDECPQRDLTAAGLAGLPPLRDGEPVTQAQLSQPADAAAALLIASPAAVREFGLRPRARISHLIALGADPVLMHTAPIPATEQALVRAGMRLADLDVIEINEVSAPAVLAWQRATGADPARVNPSGGAIALGDPVGAAGPRLLTTLLYELERSGGRYGLVAMAQAGGQATVTIVERL